MKAKTKEVRDHLMSELFGLEFTRPVMVDEHGEFLTDTAIPPFLAAMYHAIGWSTAERILSIDCPGIECRGKVKGESICLQIYGEEPRQPED